jgi:hypothetical protein
MFIETFFFRLFDLNYIGIVNSDFHAAELNIAYGAKDIALHIIQFIAVLFFTHPTSIANYQKTFGLGESLSISARLCLSRTSEMALRTSIITLRITQAVSSMQSSHFL